MYHIFFIQFSVDGHFGFFHVLALVNSAATYNMNGLPRWCWGWGTCLPTQETSRYGPWVRKIPGGGHDNPLQYSCLENPHGPRSLAGYSP